MDTSPRSGRGRPLRQIVCPVNPIHDLHSTKVIQFDALRTCARGPNFGQRLPWTIWK